MPLFVIIIIFMTNTNILIRLFKTTQKKTFLVKWKKLQLMRNFNSMSLESVKNRLDALQF